MEDPNKLLGGLTRETQIYRDARGRWFNEGQPLEHPNLVRSFEGWVDRAEDGRYCVSNDINWAYIQLDGPAYFVRAVRIGPQGRITLHLSGDREEVLDASTLRQDENGVLYCDVREGRVPARFDAHAMMQLEECLRQDDEGLFLQLGNRRVRPPHAADPLQTVKNDG